MNRRISTLMLAALTGVAAGCGLNPGNAQAPATAAEHQSRSHSPSTDVSAQAASRKPTSAATPAAVLSRYYQAIDESNYAEAYALWGRNGRASGKTLGEFKKGFSNTATSQITVRTPRDREGAAGSLYITVPVSLTATLKSGKTQHFAGTYVLRKANNIPGASATQRGWHIYSATLHATDSQ